MQEQKMIKEGNADSKWSEKKLEEEDNVRTVDCLRGRLQAERVASKNAKDEAEQLENKLIELENLLKEEAKSRNRAEKKLKLLIKKLESMNISYVSEDKIDFSPISSTASSSSTKEFKVQSKSNPQFNISTMVESQEPMEKAESPKGSENSQQNDSPTGVLSYSCGNSSTTEGSSSSAFDPECQEFEMRSNENTTYQIVQENFEHKVAKKITAFEDSEGGPSYQKQSPVESDQCHNCSKADEQSVESPNENDQDPDNTDDSMALVLVDTPQKDHEPIDPEMLDASVKEVLDALRRAKEQLQSSMEKKRMNIIRVG